MTKEKKYVFRHYRKVESLHPADIEKMKKVLIERCLSRGYIPFEPEVQTISYDGYYEKIDRVSTACAYVGKVQARKLGVQKRPTVVNLYD